MHTPGVNFTNILRAALAPIFLRQQSTNPKSPYEKAARKMFVKLTPEVVNFDQYEVLKTC
jgi:hypothetical protein